MTSLSWWVLPLLMALLVGMVCPVTGALLITQRRVLQANLISHAVCLDWCWPWRSKWIRSLVV